MVENITSIIVAVIGTMGFCLFLRVRKHRLPVIAVSTALCYGIYLASLYIMHSNNISIFIASVSAAVVSEIFARCFKAPVTVFLIPTILPMIPGAALYYTVDALFRSEMQTFLEYLALTGKTIGAMLLGITTVTAIVKTIRNHRRWQNNDPTLKYQRGR